MNYMALLSGYLRIMSAYLYFRILIGKEIAVVSVQGIKVELQPFSDRIFSEMTSRSYVHHRLHIHLLQNYSTTRGWKFMAK